MPTTIGPYAIERELGRGGMGVVYRARHGVHGREVALKLLDSSLAQDPIALERFRREAETLTNLDHADIVKVLEVGEWNGQPFLAMELIEGQTLARRLRERGALSFREAVTICRHVAAALGAAHARGLVHRDVKPSNVLIDPLGRAKITDFGIARRMKSDDERLTRSHAVVGTPQYMSPEQASGRLEPLAASDVYSLGVVLYEMLAGAHPLAKATPSEALAGHLTQAFPPIRRYRPDVPDSLEQSLEKCLRKDPRERYPDGRALAERLSQISNAIEAARLDAGTFSTLNGSSSLEMTALHYIDARPESEAPMGELLLLFREAVAQWLDPNRALRRRLNRLAVEMAAPKARLVALEAEISALSERQENHEERAQEHARRCERLVAEGSALDAEDAAEEENRHTRWALEYETQGKKLRFELKNPERDFEPLRREYSLLEDRLYLADCEARRRGRLLPSWQTDRRLARNGRVLRYLLLVPPVLLFHLSQWSILALYLVFVYVLARYAATSTDTHASSIPVMGSDADRRH
jgi:predicted Ser/Thr protein kinase